eukprot:5693395-Amphidinium_carterae.1
MLPPEGDDFEKVLHEASARWSQLQANLDEAEDVFLTQRGDLFRKWFALEDADLTVRTEGGLRHTIHDRVQRPPSCTLHPSRNESEETVDGLTICKHGGP